MGTVASTGTISSFAANDDVNAGPLQNTFTTIVNYIDNHNDGTSAWDKLIVNQTAAADIAVFKDSGSAVMTIADGGNVTLTGRLYAGDGTVGLPSLSFGSDTDSGFYYVSSGVIGFAIGGVNKLQLDGNGITSAALYTAPVGSASAPTYTFASDTNTGLWRDGADVVAVTCGGSTMLWVRSTTSEVASDFAPSTNNTRNLGNGTNRWAEVFAVNGTINTSHSTQKAEVQEIPNVVIPRGKMFRRQEGDGTLSDRFYIGYLNDELPQECRPFDKKSGKWSDIDNYENSVTGMLCEGYWSHEDKIKALEKEIRELKGKA